MSLGLLLGVIRARAALRRRDGLDRQTLLDFQARSLATLRSFAVARSPLYRELHRGLEAAPLTALPIVTKAMLMERFDDLVTDRDVRLADVIRFLDRAAVLDRFRGRYRVSATGGTTGRRGIFLADPVEWQTIVASYARAYDWAGIAAGLTNRIRMAVVSSRHPSHQSAIVGATVRSRLLPTLRLDASETLPSIVTALNEFRPDALVGYASILRQLAAEQSAGRLAIRPRGVMSASEVLTDDARARITGAFGVQPTNVYAATETAGIASECHHGRMHRYEDLVIAEIVDGDGRPVPDGEVGTRLLVTVLWSRTQPLIRYELSDRVAAAPGTCPDGRPFSLLAGIEGREEEVLTLRGIGVHPNVFHVALEDLPVDGWQVVGADDRLRIILAGARPALDAAGVVARVRRALDAHGVGTVAVEIELVSSIPRTALGKAPLVRRAGLPDAGRSATMSGRYP